jgi:hypothetical protein
VIVEIIVAEPEEGPMISQKLWVAMYLQRRRMKERSKSSGCDIRRER